MRFTFDEAATVQAAAYLLERAGGRMNYTALLKLLYLADREKIAQVGSPISGATYVSMPLGPVLSEVLSYIQEEPDHESSLWEKYIAAASEFDVRLKAPMDLRRLSRGDKRILEEIFAQFGSWSYGSLVEHCHRHLPEWRDPIPLGKRRLPLDPEDILKALGKRPEEIAEARQDAAYYNWFDQRVAARD